MMTAAGNGQITVPPGFRFHPTEEELLYYYLRKKISYQPIDLDVIRDVDLNKLEPWDLKEKCRVGSGPQTEWYFFSHKDKKYPTGTRTNRATMAGFWKATGRDKVIHVGNAKRIGMRKTLVFYIGRAPNGQKTDWIMHEYRLNEDSSDQFQENGWVVCRVFKKKTHQREIFHPNSTVEQELQPSNHLRTNMISPSILQNNPNLHEIPWDFSFDNSMQLPQLLSAESSAFTTTPFNPTSSLNVSDIECSENLMKLMATNSVSTGTLVQQERLNGDWSVLDKLLASHQNLDELIRGRNGFLPQSSSQIMNSTVNGGLMQKFLAQYVGSEEGVMKFSK